MIILLVILLGLLVLLPLRAYYASINTSKDYFWELYQGFRDDFNKIILRIGIDIRDNDCKIRKNESKIDKLQNRFYNELESTNVQIKRLNDIVILHAQRIDQLAEALKLKYVVEPDTKGFTGYRK